MKFESTKSTTKWWLIFMLLAILTFLLTRIAASNQQWIEQNYAQGIYPLIAKILSSVSAVVPISLDDIFYLVLLLMPLSIIALLILRKISFQYAGKLFIKTLSVVYILFYLLWGFNYFRQGISERLTLKEAQADKEEFIEILSQIIEHTNNLHCSFNESDQKQADSLIEESYMKLAPALKIPYPMGKRMDKKITFSGFYAKSGITGYFGPFFNEVHVNKKVLPIEYPSVLAHEKAHQLGVTSEAEANFYSWLVCSNSTSQQIQYSGNLFILFHFLRQAYELEEYHSLVEQISPEVKEDFNHIRQHWKKLRNETLNKTASKVNDAYLKTNKLEAGIRDYNGVVKHVMNFSLDSAFQKRHGLADN